jgi:hypothetical protein
MGEMDRDEKKIHGWGKRHRDDKKETCVGKDAQGRGKIARHGLGKKAMITTKLYKSVVGINREDVVPKFHASSGPFIF